MLLNHDALHFEVVLWWFDEAGPHEYLGRKSQDVSPSAFKWNKAQSGQVIFLRSHSYA